MVYSSAVLYFTSLAPMMPDLQLHTTFKPKSSFFFLLLHVFLCLLEHEKSRLSVFLAAVCITIDVLSFLLPLNVTMTGHLRLSLYFYTVLAVEDNQIFIL